MMASPTLLSRLVKYGLTVCLVVMVMLTINSITTTSTECPSCDDGPRELTLENVEVPRLNPGRAERAPNTRSGADVFRTVYQTLDEIGETANFAGPANASTVLIHADFRSGSTFTSDLFVKNSFFYYLYEPFYVVPVKDVARKMLSLLVDLFDCDFNRLVYLADRNQKFINMPRLLDNWLQKLFCWRNITNRDCWKKPVEEFEAECERHAHRVIKSIRVPELELLQPLMEGGLQVIQLIRDPRGVISSRRKMANHSMNADRLKLDMVAHNLYAESRLYCLNIERDMRYAHYMLTRHNNSYFSKNYHPVRYEDLATRPKRHLLDIYTHFNLPMDPNVMKWAEDIDDRNSGVSKGGPVKQEHSLRTERNNSTQTAMAWRTHLSFESVQIIQQACGGLMSDLGYILVPDKDYLLDMNKPVMYFL